MDDENAEAPPEHPGQVNDLPTGPYEQPADQSAGQQSDQPAEAVDTGAGANPGGIDVPDATGAKNPGGYDIPGTPEAYPRFDPKVIPDENRPTDTASGDRADRLTADELDPSDPDLAVYTPPMHPNRPGSQQGERIAGVSSAAPKTVVADPSGLAHFTEDTLSPDHPDAIPHYAERIRKVASDFDGELATVSKKLLGNVAALLERLHRRGGSFVPWTAAEGDLPPAVVPRRPVMPVAGPAGPTEDDEVPF